jgi:hypothetical protein
MSRVAVAGILVLAISAVAAEKPLSVPDILPEGTIVYAEIGPWAQWSKDFSETALAKVFSEPEVRTFLAGPFAQVAALIKKVTEEKTPPNAPPPPPAPGPAAGAPGAIASLFQVLGEAARGPMVVAVRYSADDAQAKRPPAIAVILGIGEQQNLEAKNNMVASLLDMVVNNWKIEAVAVTDYQNTKLISISTGDAGQRRNLVTVMYHKGFLVVSNEVKLSTQFIDGLAGTLPRKLSDTPAYKDTGLTGNENLAAYLDVAGVQKALGSRPAGEGAGQVNEYFTLAGLDKASVAAWSLKMNGAAFESRAAIFSQGQRTGLIGMLSEDPVSMDALKLCPKVTPVALGFRLQPDRILPFLHNAVQTLRGQKGLDDFTAAEKQINAELGKDFEKELRAAYGNEVVIASLGPGENVGVAGVSSLAASLSVQDMKRAEELLSQMLTRWAAKIDEKGAAGNVLKEVEYEGLKIRYLTIPRVVGVFEFAPAFVLAENRLVVGMDVPTLKLALRTLKEASSLQDTEPFKTALAQTGGKMGPFFTYMDWAYAYRSFFSMSATALKLIAPTDVLRAAGIDLNLLPSTDVVAKHLFPGLAVARITPSGVVMTSRSPVPSLEVIAPPITTVAAIFASFKPFLTAPVPEKK